MGGAGKTTLLRHLGWWWQTTGFVDQVFYFGYDQRAWTRQQIMDAIARELLGDVGYVRDFQPLGLEAQQALLAERLRGTRHLLILDNLESITGAELAIQHTLPKAEQQALQRFLQALAGGQTLVLLGSRGGEAWLQAGTFDDNVYILPGLDDEAASELADLILARHGATKYRSDPDLRRLLALLNGYPLALEVVLPNLAKQTPAEVLAALWSGAPGLESGEVDLANPDIQKKTQSILHCIAYSHSNLSPDAQTLLLCLAPFTGVIYLGALEAYTDALRQQPALAHLPFERWDEVLQEAMNWGLLTPHEVEGFLRIQPTLPYFLRSRLQWQSRRGHAQAVETAFRQHYDQLGRHIARLLQSKDARSGRPARSLAQSEYENLCAAAALALAATGSFFNAYGALSSYLDSHTGHRPARLELSERYLTRIGQVSGRRSLAGELASELLPRSGATSARCHLQAQAVRCGGSRPIEQALSSCSMTIAGDLTTTAAEARRRLSTISWGGWRRSSGSGRRPSSTTNRPWPSTSSSTTAITRRPPTISWGVWRRSSGSGRRPSSTTSRPWPSKSSSTTAIRRRPPTIIWGVWRRSSGSGRRPSSTTSRPWPSTSSSTTAIPRRPPTISWGWWRRSSGSGRRPSSTTNRPWPSSSSSTTAIPRRPPTISWGCVAQEQRQWAQAEQYYQQALAIYIEFNDRYAQAATYHQLGIVAQEQRQWAQAEQYYQQALAIYIEFNDRYSQASTYHQLGIVAQEQRQWAQAEQYYQQALAIYIEFNDRYSQASTYHQLGIVAQEQRQWAQAEQYYQQALAIKIEFNDRYSQASTYHQLGIVAQEQRQWAQAEQYYQQALAIYIEFNDRYSQASTYHNWGLWRRSSGSGRRPSSTTNRPWPSKSSSTTAIPRRPPTISWGVWRRSSGSGRRPGRLSHCPANLRGIRGRSTIGPSCCPVCSPLRKPPMTPPCPLPSPPSWASHPPRRRRCSRRLVNYYHVLEALRTFVELMRSAKSEKVRLDATTTLLALAGVRPAEVLRKRSPQP